ncbi:MAG: hypothetical protein KatS3mg068_0730 [Candidatus Sericytochromatia bacterium]|nr:MAG: hypothetical protein KatS3mg068_0730 [Candidatus Sericytochromatia bacterium]
MKIVLVLEDIYQTQNASNIVRTAELLGIKEINVIENRNKFIIDSNISLGAEKYLNINKFKNAENCVNYLKENNFKLVATIPKNINSYTLDNFPYFEKIALLMGTEKLGLSEYLIKNSDIFLTIETYGFTQSLNVGVSTAIIIYELVHKFKSK